MFNFKRFYIGIQLAFATAYAWILMQELHLKAIITKDKNLENKYKMYRYRFHRSW